MALRKLKLALKMDKIKWGTMPLCHFPPLQNHSEITMRKLPFNQQNDATLHSFPVHL